MAEKRFHTSRAELAKTATTRPRRKREVPPDLARRLAATRRIAIMLITLGGGGIAAGLVLVITAHPAIGAVPLIVGAFVLYRGERKLSRVDTAIRKQIYGGAAGVWISGAGGGGCVGGTCGAGHGGCSAGGCGGGGCGGGGN